MTICTHQKQCLLGEVVDGMMQLNSAGLLIQAFWNDLPKHFQFLELDAFIIMPNHLHGILVIDRATSDENDFPSRNNWQGTKSGSLAAVLQNFKSVSTRKINKLQKSPGTPLWQKNYYEHIVRDARSLDNIRRYIVENPQCWAEDRSALE